MRVACSKARASTTAPYLEDHNERLLNLARILGFEVPAGMDDLAKATQEVITSNNIVDGYVRPIAWRGAEQMGVSAQATKIHLALAAWDWPAYFSPEARAKGIRMQWARWARPAPHTAPTAAKERAAESLRHVGLYEERYRQIGTYSTGMKQRVKLAQALVGDPRLLLLDEPTVGLDPAGRTSMLELISRIGAEFGISIVVASHLLG